MNLSWKLPSCECDSTSTTEFQTSPYSGIAQDSEPGSCKALYGGRCNRIRVVASRMFQGYVFEGQRNCRFEGASHWESR